MLIYSILPIVFPARLLERERRPELAVDEVRVLHPECIRVVLYRRTESVRIPDLAHGFHVSASPTRCGS